MKRLIAVAVASLVGHAVLLPAVAPAQETVLALAIAPYNRLLEDVAYVGRVGDRPQSSQMIEGGVAAVTGGKGLAGLDQDRPWGVLVNAAQDFGYVGVLPVDDLDALLDSFQGFVTAEDEGNLKVLQVAGSVMPIFVQQEGDWAYLATTPDHFAMMPSGATDLLAELTEERDVCLKAFVPNVPDMYKQMASGLIKQQATQQMPGESNADYENRMAVLGPQLDQFDRAINEMNTLTVGITVNGEGGGAELDVEVTVLPGTESAMELADLTSKSLFSGFVGGEAAASANFSMIIPESQTEQALQGIEPARAQVMQAIDDEANIPDEATRDEIKEALGELFDQAVDSIKEGRLDVSGKLDLSDGFTLLAGAYCADGAALEQTLRKLAAIAGRDPNFPGVEFDAATHGDVDFHTLSVPTPDADARRIFGDAINVVVGTGPKATYLGLGADAIDGLSAAIDSSAAAGEQDAAPMHFEASLAKVLRFAADASNEQEPGMLADILEESTAGDMVQAEVSIIELGERITFSIDEGVIRLMMKAPEMMQQ